MVGSTDTVTSDGVNASTGVTDSQFPVAMRTLVLNREVAVPELILIICDGGRVLPKRCENPREAGDEAKEVGVVTVSVTGMLICPAVTD